MSEVCVRCRLGRHRELGGPLRLMSRRINVGPKNTSGPPTNCARTQGLMRTHAKLRKPVECRHHDAALGPADGAADALDGDGAADARAARFGSGYRQHGELNRMPGPGPAPKRPAHKAEGKRRADDGGVLAAHGPVRSAGRRPDLARWHRTGLLETGRVRAGGRQVVHCFRARDAVNVLATTLPGLVR